MRYFWFSGACVASGLVLAACATLNEEECQAVDWAALGSQDAQNGYSQGRVGEHAKACARHDIDVDFDAYAQGWFAGIPAFCTPQRGYDFGIEGRRYRNTCPVDLAAPFEAAYRPAKAQYDAEDAVTTLERKLENTSERIIRLSESEDPEDLELAAELRKEQRSIRDDLDLARREADLARREVLLFLRRNPYIVP